MLTSPVFKFDLCPTLFASPNSSFSTGNNITRSRPSLATPTTTVRKNNGRVNAAISTSPLTSEENTLTPIFSVRVIVSVELQPNEISEDGTLVLELVSAKDGHRIVGRAEKMPSPFRISLPIPTTNFKFGCSFEVPHSFGEVGAIIVENERNSEVLVQNIMISGFGKQASTWSCNSWVQPKRNNPDTRVFFANKSYLPSMTPNGLKSLREKDLESLRGNGKGVRKWPDRIYDYDLYNDLGDPDKSDDLARPVLGGKERPYPRRCRTGRGPSKKDPLTEKKIGANEYNYLPRDENFHLRMLGGFSRYAEKQPILEYLAAACGDSGFPSLEKINSLFGQGLPIPVDTDSHMPTRIGPLSESISLIEKAGLIYLKFEPPEPYKKDNHFWFRDEEFARQTLAGLNPYSIQLVTEWPMYSTLGPSYGSSESLIDHNTVEKQINNVMTCKQAINKKRLFVLDYHDLLLPYVKQVRELDGTTLYGSRTLFFLCDDGTLKPIAIELTRPPIDDKPEWRQVFTPPIHNKPEWIQPFPPSTLPLEDMDMLLWMLAKAHVGSHDLINHQLNTHWLRTHCCTEPYIIATHRQLSAMHPIYRLLNPHIRYTMDINGFGRKTLISAGGIAETVLSLGKYSMQFTTDFYAKHWRFDKEALPEDLIRRGMAVRDPEAKHGLRLTIEDYPFANDGLILWDAIVSWVTDYVQHYYADANAIVSDTELQAWWTDIKTRGHPDKKDEPWWPVLDTRENLVQTLSTIIWVASGHHAAVNFGQYTYGGYFPNRIADARTNMPSEDEKLFRKSFTNMPSKESDEGFNNTREAILMECFPSEFKATSMMAVFDLLSTHSAYEEYIGQKIEVSWLENPVIKAAFEKFQAEMQSMEEIINERNANVKLKNRTGAHIIPYELLKPKSKPGLTGMGVPNSISI